MKFLEDCPVQPLIPLYLLVGGVIGSLKVTCLLCVKNILCDLTLTCWLRHSDSSRQPHAPSTGELAGLDCACSSTKSTHQSSEMLMSSALSHTLWCDFLLHHSICATIPTEGNDYLTWMPVINGVLFPQAILQACQIFLHYFHTDRTKS